MGGISARSGAVDPSGARETSSAALVAAANLRVDLATAELLNLFREAGVRTLLIKGPSIARWLYDEPGSRAYIDCDLLLRPGDDALASRVLVSHRFERGFDDSTMPEWWRQHASCWLSTETGLTLDLHRTIPGARASPESVWLALSRHAETLDVCGWSADVLSIPARALHVALHVAHHGPGGHALTDLDRALTRVDEQTWREAAELATELDAAAALAAGLRVDPRGEALAERLGLSAVASLDVGLRAAGERQQALTVDLFVRASPRRRVAIVRYKLFPPVAYMRHWSPRAKRGRIGLVLAYYQRALWLMRGLAPAVSAWRRTRDAVRSGRPRS